jgi:flagellar biosynthesis protein FlhG
MIVVTGGSAGVGVTTVAVNLATVLADWDQRVLLVDAAQERRNTAEFAGLDWSKVDRTLSDVLAGRCKAAEAVTPGPAGVRLLADHGARRKSADFPRRAQQRLLDGLDELRTEFDVFVIDLGSGLTPWARRFWLHAQLVLLTTTTDGSALLDSYAMIKRSVIDRIGPEVRVVVNQAENEKLAADAHHRLSNACSRFLGRAMPSLPSLPRCDDDGNGGPLPRVWDTPDTPFGHAMLWLSRAVRDVLSQHDLETHACATACGTLSRVHSSRSTVRC